MYTKNHFKVHAAVKERHSGDPKCNPPPELSLSLIKTVNEA